MYFPNFPILNNSETDLTAAKNSSTEIAAIFVVNKTELTNHRLQEIGVACLPIATCFVKKNLLSSAE